MMGATLRSLAIVGAAALVSGILSRWIAKTITLSPEPNATTRMQNGSTAGSPPR